MLYLSSYRQVLITFIAKKGKKKKNTRKITGEIAQPSPGFVYTREELAGGPTSFSAATSSQQHRKLSIRRTVKDMRVEEGTIQRRRSEINHVDKLLILTHPYSSSTI